MLLANPNLSGAVIAFFLDNTVPGRLTISKLNISYNTPSHLSCKQATFNTLKPV